VRLLTKLRKLEAERAAAQAESERLARVHVPSAVMWTERAATIDASALAEGEELAVDYTILSGGEGFTIASCVERVTRDPSDFGKVFDASGREIGRVRESEGAGIIAYTLFPESVAAQG
jgi:hypothetical protein